MKTKTNLLCAFAALTLFSVVSCVSPVKEAAEPATLRLRFDASTRSSGAPSDAAFYTLDISASDGSSIFRGPWSDRPSEFKLYADIYTVSVYSSEFEDPCFDDPQFGDSKSVVLADGQVAEVQLVASQMNAGIRVLFSEKFIASYKEGAVFLRSSEGTLALGYSETRTAFFKPGPVVILLNYKGKTYTVHSMVLNAGEIMCLSLTVSEEMPKALSVSLLDCSVRVDTSRIWKEESLAWNGSSSGTGPVDNPGEVLSVSEARDKAGSKDVWVCGYIVGGDLSSSSCSFSSPFSARTNMMIADDASCREREECMSVQLSQGDIRNALNLVDNPAMLGRKVWLRGDVVAAYYKLPGLQNLSEYRM